ncbi:MAG: hypothetical protein M1812_003480 [Candelaria pacifica]|nr:MAG: hypothetical protein M1812_003480 [Candelaria pacifica]
MYSSKSIFTAPNKFHSQEFGRDRPSKERVTPASFGHTTEAPQRSEIGNLIHQSLGSCGTINKKRCSADGSISQAQGNTRPPLSSSATQYRSNVTFVTKTGNPLIAGRNRLPLVDSTTNGSHGEEPFSKRICRRQKPGHTLDLSGFPKGPATDRVSPVSPLFFSHSPKRRPPLPPRFSSSEAGAKMLGKVRAEDKSGIKTVKLARGTFNSSSPPRAMSVSSGRGSVYTPGHTSAVTPGSIGAYPGLQVLSHIGIIELLEQDERPTFIIDLGNFTNFRPGPLEIEFANATLRASEELLGSVTGQTSSGSPGSPVSSTFPEFKEWVIGSTKSQDSPEVPSASFLYGSVTWTSSTLRNRLRLISGNHILDSVPARSPSSSVGLSRISATTVERPKPFANTNGSRNSNDGKDKEAIGDFDYFGDAALPSPTPPTLTTESDNVTNQDKSHTTDRGDRKTLSEQLSRAHVAASVGSEALLTEKATLQAEEEGFFDWTRLPLSQSLPHHIQFARSIDWAATSLGPIDQWPAALRSMCNLIMASPYPAAMYWGDDYIAIYNEAYIPLAGQKHPMLMGQSYKEAWAEIWNDVRDVFASAKTTGEATMKDDDCLFLRRSGFLEECYFSWSIIPLIGDEGTVVGLYNPAFEKTRRKVAERRMLTLREVGERTSAAREVTGFWGQVLKGLDYNDCDTPFIILYSVSDEAESDACSTYSNSILGSKQCLLEGTLGVPQGHFAAPPQLDLKSSRETFAPAFREAMKGDQPVILDTENGTLSTEWMEGFEWRGFGDPCSVVVVCPIHPTTGGGEGAILGFLVMGINPRRPYDDDYSLFIQLLCRQLGTAMASVVLFEEEIRRGQRAANLAALDRIELSQQLAARTQEAAESEMRFTHMAEFAPVGMFIADSTGRITYCNDAWYDISRHPREESSADAWMEFVKEEDIETVKHMWFNVVEKKIPGTAEYRYKTQWEDKNGTKGDTWVLASAYPETAEDGSLKSVFGSITNISQQKWAEDLQKRRMEEAVELKRQQENFIDITSHEMRNPLSAILQCADEIITSLSGFRSNHEESATLSAELVDSNIDAAQTIALCAQHQKRIVDDVLTMSKLDSKLLLVTPVDVSPTSVVQRALKMFEGELEKADIEMRFVVDKSYKDLHIEWVKMDPSRLLQVLINLTTNAIKFTTTESRRTITVTVGASSERPTKENTNMSYFPSRSNRKSSITGADWGNGERVFLHFAVQDTGRGLSESEKKSLFMRFSQASPRTHVQYGGSGLGLFISRELTELQGGEIGVTSESGKGSTFAFYIQARRSSASKDEVEVQTPIPRKSSEIRNKLASQAKADQPSTARVLSATRKAEGAFQVLIVEDNLVNQRVLQKQLRNLGCVAHVANHGGEALDWLQKSRYWKDRNQDAPDLSVVLMDQEMPVMDGLTCARRIREYEQSGQIVRHVPIIAVTANARSEQIATAVEAGMDDVVSKPFRVSELMPKIEELVAKYKFP